jgi:hypothetical protein
MLNVWKYGYLSENLTFIGHLCEICYMCQKYGYLMSCVLFLKPCIQFLMDTILKTILNLAIIMFLIEEKGDMH